MDIADNSANGIINHPPARISDPSPIVSGFAAAWAACKNIIVVRI